MIIFCAFISILLIASHHFLYQDGIALGSRRRIVGVIILALCSVSVAAYFQREFFFNTGIMYEDQFAHVYWTQIFQNPNLFQNDYLTQYTIHCSPVGYYYFYKIVSYVCDPVTFSFFVVLIAAFCGTFYFYLTLEKLTNSKTAWFGACFFMTDAVILSKIASGGVQRTFAVPFIVAFIYYLITQSGIRASVVLVLSALFYPFSFIVNAAVFLFMAAVQALQKNWSKRFFIPMGIALLVGLYFLIHQSDTHLKNNYGSVVSKQETLNDAVYDEGVYSPPGKHIYPKINYDKTHLQYTWFYTIATFIKNKRWDSFPNALYQGIFVSNILIYAYIIFRYRKRYERLCVLISTLLFIGWALYEIAYLVIFRLYFPRRYIEYTLPLAGVLMYAVIGAALFERLASCKVRNYIALISFVIMIAWVGHHHTVVNPQLKKTPSQIQDVLNYLQTLPIDSTIATNNDQLANRIPMMSQRKVLVNLKLAQPYHRKYYAEIRRRYREFYRAIYADDLRVISDFMAEFDVDYLVIDRKYFERPSPWMKYYAPGVWSRYKQIRVSYLERLSDKAILFEEAGRRYFVVDRNSLK